MPLGLYPPKAGSPETYLDGGINDSVTTINVLDASVLPDPPNIATIGTRQDSETVRYTNIAGNQLVGCTRGFEGAAKAWNTGTLIANVPAAQHIKALQQKALGIESDLTAHVGDTTHVRILAQNAYTATDSGTLYPIGNTMFNVVSDSSWPFVHGFVVNLKVSDARFAQWYYHYAASGVTGAWYRHSYTSTWSAWQNINHVSINEQTGASYTLALSDDGKDIEMNRASAQTLTIPTNASVPFPIGTQILVAQKGAGQVTIAGAGGVTLLLFESESRTIGQNAMAGLIKIATDTWRVRGDLEVAV